MKKRKEPAALVVVLGQTGLAAKEQRYLRALLLSLCKTLEDDDRLCIVHRGPDGFVALPFGEVAAYRLRAALPLLERSFLAQADEGERRAYLALTAEQRAMRWVAGLPETLPDSLVLPLLSDLFDELVVPRNEAPLADGIALALTKIAPAMGDNVGLLVLADTSPEGFPAALEDESLQAFRRRFLLPSVEIQGDGRVLVGVSWGKTWPTTTTGLDGIAELVVTGLRSIHEISYVTRDARLVEEDLRIRYSSGNELFFVVDHPVENRLPREALLLALQRLPPGDEGAGARRELLEALEVHRDPELAAFVRELRQRGLSEAEPDDGQMTNTTPRRSEP